MSTALRVHGALSRGVFAVTVLISLAVLFTPGGDVPSAPPGVDKVVHATLFAALAVTGSWAGVRRGVLAGLLVIWGAVSEVLQGIPVLDRDPALGDWVADVLGALAGLLIWAAVDRRRSAG
jgi:VanZ family protein